MNSKLTNYCKLSLVALLALGLSAGTAWSKPSIQSIDVSPDPLITGQNFAIAVTASADVTAGTVTVDFHPGDSQEVALVKRGPLWTAAGIVPDDLSAHAKANIKIVLVDANGRKTQQMTHVDVTPPTVSAVFEGGILTVTGDDGDNALTVGRDAAGTILVNNGALLISGGVPTVSNTTLIRILGFKGNDELTIQNGGAMPPANLFGGEGNDTLTGGLADDLLDGGPGNDILNGGPGNDTLNGGTGNDSLTGGLGVDQLVGGDGDDEIVWNPGDGSDVVEGDVGKDTLVFFGSAANEIIDLSSNGERLRFFRNVANITMDCDGVEVVVFHAQSGADQVTVNNLKSTQVTNVLIDLLALGIGDTNVDTVIVNGTETNDLITVSGTASNIVVTGLSASVAVIGAEPNLDKLVINTLAGDDSVDGSSSPFALTLNGGPGIDLLIGGVFNDVLNGGPDNDVEFGGAGDDTFPWNPGDGSDTLEGEAGNDTMVFNGANIAETVDMAANGQRLRFLRNVANIAMDCNDVETVQFNALGGADTITVNDLTGTDVKIVDLHLAAALDSTNGDNTADTVVVTGTAGNDSTTVTGNSINGVSVLGLAARINVTGTDPTLDKLVINALGGDDVVESSNLQAGVINLTADGGPGDDILIGSAGADVLRGGDDDDILIGGPGVDVLDGGAGNNVVIPD